MHARNLPVDVSYIFICSTFSPNQHQYAFNFTNFRQKVRDDQYEYKVISDYHLDKEFNLWNTFKDGRIVPYPSRVEGTEMWQRARDAVEAAAAAANAAASENAATSGRGKGRGRGANKRKPNELAEGPPTPKRSRGADVGRLLDAALSAPAPAKGLLASAAAVDQVAEGTPGDVNSISGTPEPGGYFESRNQEDIPLRARSPPLPKKLTEPDEHNVRMYWQTKNNRDKPNSNRFLVPFREYFDELDIGFRDSSNDSSRPNMTWAKRGKYMHTSNSDALHHDWTLANYDYTKLQPDDFDEELVKRHGLHTRYGLFLPESTNEQETPSPYNMPGKPVVYIAQPSGRIAHASRSFQATVNERREADAPWRRKIGAAMRRFIKMNDFTDEELSLQGVAPTDEELRERSLGVATKQLEARPSPGDEVNEDTDVEQPEAPNQLAMLLEAAQTVTAPEPKPPTPAPTRAYDAVRDAIMGGDAPEERVSAPAAKEDVTSLTCLADACLTSQSNAATSSQVPRSSFMEPAPSAEHDPRLVSSGPAPPSVPVSQPQPPQQPLVPVSRAPIPDSQAPMSAERHSIYVPAPPQRSHKESRAPAPGSPLQPAHPGHHAPPQPAHSYPQNSSYGIEYPGVHSGYPSVHDRRSREPVREHNPPPQHPQRPYGSEYPPAHSYPAPHQEPSYSHPPPHPGYPTPHDPRDPHARPPGRPSDYGYEPMRPGPYGAEQHPGYARPYWSDQPPPGPPPPQGPLGLPSAHPTPAQQSAQPYFPPPGGQRAPFSHQGSAEPLPPLRPSRARSIHEDPGQEALPRHPVQPGGYANNYPFNYGRGGYPSYPEAQQTQHPYGQMHGERLMTNQPPYQHQSAPPGPYGGPSQGYPTTYSPTTAHPPPQMMHSPSETDANLSGGHLRHRSSGSISGAPIAPGDPNAANKYRKLQPAPVPPHRAWTNKPELKTIPYDHKYVGQIAELPSSGPTTIRGWNINAHKKRPRVDHKAAAALAAAATEADRHEPVNEREDSR